MELTKTSLTRTLTVLQNLILTYTENANNVEDSHSVPYIYYYAYNVHDSTLFISSFCVKYSQNLIDHFKVVDLES